jgi:hypothetical protein
MIDRLLARGGLAGDEEDYLDVLADLVEKYEDEHYPIEPVSGLDALRHLVDSSGKTQATVAAEAGLPANAASASSEVSYQSSKHDPLPYPNTTPAAGMWNTNGSTGIALMDSKSPSRKPIPSVS